ncbi:MAG: helix-turn-helix transcriptional regulator [Ruminococcaceae bacterium]|nr:helix-turn-helix transcriptional regulator [Oscillospiraceae bacterium]
MKSPSLITILKKQPDSTYHVSPHGHDYYELVYYYTGGGTTTLAGKQYTFSDETVVVIPPRLEHDEQHYRSGSLICIGFSSDVPLFFDLFTDSNHVVDNILRAILSEASSQLPLYREMIAIKLSELILILSRRNNSDSRTQNTKNFEYVINYISENYHEKIVMSDFADQLGISYDYFQHRFHRLTGFSPRQLLIQKRLEAAGELLTSTTLSCTEIAYRCGFSNSAQLSMLFKKHYSLTPLQYRDRLCR